MDETGGRTHVGDGYSGRGRGLNNPNRETEPNVGPIPKGEYEMGKPRDSERTGKAVIDLTPKDGTNTHGRGAFQVHGDNSLGNQSASRGCIVTGRETREKMSKGKTRDLVVVE